MYIPEWGPVIGDVQFWRPPISEISQATAGDLFHELDDRVFKTSVQYFMNREWRGFLDGVPHKGQNLRPGHYDEKEQLYAKTAAAARLGTITVPGSSAPEAAARRHNSPEVDVEPWNRSDVEESMLVPGDFFQLEKTMNPHTLTRGGGGGGRTYKIVHSLVIAPPQTISIPSLRHCTGRWRSRC